MNPSDGASLDRDKRWEAVPDALVITDSNRRIVVFNRAAERMFGYVADEILGQPLQVLVPERFQQTHAADVDGFLSQDTGHRRTATDRPVLTGRRKGGDEFPAEISLASLEEGEEQFALAIVRDVSTRFALEKALGASEGRFRAMLHSSPVPMALTDLEMTLINGNEALAELIGGDLDEMRGQSMPALVPVSDWPGLYDKLLPLLSGSTDTATAEVQLERADGNEAILNLYAARVSQSDLEEDYLITQAIDVTEQIQANQRLEEMVRSKDDLIASISHEFRTPLTALLGFAKLLHDDSASLSESERGEMISSIVEESMDLANIVEDLLVSAKAEIGALAVVEVPVDLRAQASQVLEGWRPSQAGRVGIEGSATALGDPARVRQIVRNLFANAIRYGGEDITIQIGQTGSEAHIAVTDSGPPISEADRERIFEPYQRAHETRAVTGSLGIGLSVSRHLARLMGGDLIYRHEADQSVFQLTIPPEQLGHSGQEVANSK